MKKVWTDFHNTKRKFVIDVKCDNFVIANISDLIRLHLVLRGRVVGTWNLLVKLQPVGGRSKKLSSPQCSELVVQESHYKS